MMMINLSGTSFCDYEMLKSYKALLDEKKIIKAKIELRNVSPTPPENDYDSDYAVISEFDTLVGWIPKIKTIKKYLGEAFKEQDRYRHDIQYQRSRWTKKIRDNITVDIFRNNITPECRIDGIYHLNKRKIWGVVCEFNYQ